MKSGLILFIRGWKKKDKDAEESGVDILAILKSKLGFAGEIWDFLERLLTAFCYTLSNTDVLYYSAYMILSVLGTMVHHFFFCFHLVDLLFRFPVL